MATVAVSPFLAPGVLAVAAVILAALPAHASRAARVLLPGGGVLAAGLAAVGTRPAAEASVDALARLLCVLLAAVVAALAVAASVPGAPSSPAAGLRLRITRGAIPGAGAAALLTVTLADAAASLGALAVLAVATAMIGAVAPVPAAAADGARRIVLAAIAGSVGWLGLLLVAAGSTGAGALMLLVAAAGLGAASFDAALSARVAARLPMPLAGVVLLLPPIAAAAPLLHARAALPAGSAAAQLADAFLLLVGIASLAAGAVAVGRQRGSPARMVVALWGPALFGWGLGTAAGLQAGLAALVMAAVGGFAVLEAARVEAGFARRAALLAAASLPPFGGFAALALLAEAALPTRPALGVVFLGALGAFSFAVLRVRGPAGAGGPALLIGALALSAVLGVAMPAPMADALVDAAGLVAGGGG